MDTPKSKRPNLYRSVKVANLGNRRHGKHHDLTAGILRELKMLKQGLALQIPLATVGGVELSSLRSAVHRAAAADNLEIETRADEMNFYVWLCQASNQSEKKLT